MSTREGNTPIDAAKKKAKHLHSILKVRIPDISLSECLNTYARIEGARNWSTFREALISPSAEENTYKKLGVFMEKTIRPLLAQIGSAHGVKISAPPSYFVANFAGDGNVVNAQPSKTFDVTLQPEGQKNSYYSFNMEVSPGAISVEKAEIVFEIPERFFNTAVSLLSSTKIPGEFTPGLIRSSENGELKYSLVLEIDGLFYSAGAVTNIWDATEKIEYVRQELDETVEKYAKLNVAFQRLAKQWGNKKLVSSFETALWGVLTGTPRYMSASPEFHSASFGDVTLTASVGKSGPYINGPGGSLNLGVSSIIYLEANAKRPAGYYIAKYGNDFEADIYLKGVGKEDLVKITAEFGIPLEYELAQSLGLSFDDIPGDYVAFFRSRAFRGLQDWVAHNRSFAKKISKSAKYIPDWYDRATGERPIPASDEELAKQRSSAKRRGRLRN